MSTPKFLPRPEAHPMQWDALMLPLKHAVRDLLVRIEGATTKNIKDEEVVANCFLVYGERGTGKTTVLLSAKYACERSGDQKNDFFSNQKVQQASSAATNEHASDSQHADDDKRTQKLLKEAKHSARNLGHVVWLDVLDMEPLSSRANPLTTVLTRVRNALCQSRSGRQIDQPTSILEDGSGRSDSANQKLSQLISDASLMWEEINEPDTRTRANRHVDAADKYARFRAQFKEALKTLSEELGRRDGNRDACYRIILPIDNIDRSTEHLYSIVKLAQMLSCPYLWLVMAGDRQDIETFLERAYWKELIQVGHGAGGVGKKNSAGEDETLIMARRQAAASSHKLLPPSHRVEVQLVMPKETLKFSPNSDAVKPNNTIRELLENIKVKKMDEEKINFIDFFCTRIFVNNSMGETAEIKNGRHHQYFTNAARLGLQLPARGVLDLWQLAYWIRQDGMTEASDQAEKIARTMLRNSITESSMSSSMGRCLQERIIRRNIKKGTDLLLGDFNPVLQVYPLHWGLFKFRGRRQILVAPEGEVGIVDVRSSLRVHKVSPMNMSLKGEGKKKNNDMLPDLVTAWLMVLYDIIGWSINSTVKFGKNQQNPVESACIVNHDFHNGQHRKWKGEKNWPMPNWNTFIENDVCGQFWDFFLNHLYESKALFDRAGRDGCLPELLCTGWVACALQTFVLFAPGDWESDQHIFTSMTNEIQKGARNGHLTQSIASAEENVMLCATIVYEKILKKNISGGSVWHEDEGTISMRDWMEQELSLMWLTDIYVPLPGDSNTRTQTIFSNFEDADLILHWKTDLHHIQQRSTKTLRKLLRSSKKKGD